MKANEGEKKKSLKERQCLDESENNNQKGHAETMGG